MPEFRGLSLWKHYNPVKITVGLDSFKDIKQYATKSGLILLVTSEGFTKRGGVDAIKNQFSVERLLVYDQVTPNPELDDLDRVTETYSRKNITCILALGGGSVMDAAKILSVTLPSQQKNPLEYNIRRGHNLDWEVNLPVTAIPTTSGTGAEVTPFATVWDSTTHKKHSISHRRVYPAHAILDPKLTLTLPRDETLYPGLDTISHALESLWNKNRTLISEAHATKSLMLANEALPILLKQPDNLPQRSRIQEASLLAGLAISQTRTAIAHSISYPLTSYFGVPHGLACSFTLPSIIEKYLMKCTKNKNTPLILSVQSQLLKLNLGGLVRKYLRSKDIDMIYKEMYLPERANNFSLSIDLDGIKYLVKSSIS